MHQPGTCAANLVTDSATLHLLDMVNSTHVSVFTVLLIIWRSHDYPEGTKYQHSATVFDQIPKARIVYWMTSHIEDYQKWKDASIY